MRAILAASLLALAACSRSSPVGETSSGATSAEATSPPSVTFTLSGALSGPRSIVQQGEARVYCTLVNEPDDAGVTSPLLVISGVENYGESAGHGVYLQFRGFTGPGTYVVGAGTTPGAAWVYDANDNVHKCGLDGQTSCYGATSGCEIAVVSWDAQPANPRAPEGLPAALGWGTASGTFSCPALTNLALGSSVSLADGAFTCVANDWTAVAPN